MRISSDYHAIQQHTHYSHVSESHTGNGLLDRALSGRDGEGIVRRGVPLRHKQSTLHGEVQPLTDGYASLAIDFRPDLLSQLVILLLLHERFVLLLSLPLEVGHFGLLEDLLARLIQVHVLRYVIV